MSRVFANHSETESFCQGGKYSVKFLGLPVSTKIEWYVACDTVLTQFKQLV